MVSKVLLNIIRALPDNFSKEEITYILIDEFGCKKDEVIRFVSGKLENKVEKDIEIIKDVKDIGMKEQIGYKSINVLNSKIDTVIDFMKARKEATIDEICRECMINKRLAYEIINILEDIGQIRQRISLFGKNKIIKVDKK
ncbi:MAG: hypothetical protein ABIG89_03150 [Candidatus Woesearchaeota archaeon]